MLLTIFQPRDSLMSTFERMLRVLGAASLSGPATLREEPSGPHASPADSRRQRKSRRRSAAAISPEPLERRQLLAVTAFAESSINGGWTTIVAESGDNVFIEQVATVPQSLYVADNSSFLNRTVVGGPAVTDNANVKSQLHINQDVSKLDTIVITTGTIRRDAGLLATGYPMVADSTTRFTLSSDGLFFDFDELSGQISIVEPDGRIESWTFSNAQQSYGTTYYRGQPRLLSGIGIDRPAKPGDYYPTAVQAIDYDPTSNSEIEVIWNTAQLPTEPTLDAVSWFHSNGWVDPRTYYRINDLAVGPSASRSAAISLPNATGPGLNPIIPSTFSGTLLVDGVAFQVSTGGPSSTSNELFFNGKTTGGWQRGEADRSITGTLEIGTQADGFRRGLTLSMSGDFTVELISAQYALASGGAPVTATVFAGHDITAALDVNLLSPGSTFNLDSPIRLAPGRPGGITVRAAEINFNAEASTANQLHIGPAIANESQALEQASAVVELVDGSVARLTIPSGFAGAGYDADNPPIVKISPPQAFTASAVLATLSNGQIQSIDVDAGGTGYTTAPTVRISSPLGANGRVATATATLTGTAVSTIIVTDSGNGYTSPPSITLSSVSGSGATASANISGSIGQVLLTNRGSGYAANSSIPIEFRSINGGAGTGAIGIATINSSGSVESIQVTGVGSGYTLSGTQIWFPDPPLNANPDGATAEAVVDPATTRIVGFKNIHPGSGYGSVPTVTISAPLPTYNALRPIGTVDAAGQVTGVAFENGTGLTVRITGVARNTGAITTVAVPLNGGGSGYAVDDIVNIDSQNTGSGQSAQFRVLAVSQTGAVMRLGVISGGNGYVRDEALVHAGTAGRGYGYTIAPRVWISRPTSPDGRQATAVASIDNAGRVLDIDITDAGSGYTAAPTVKIEAVSPRAQAETVRFNTGVGASIFSINLSDDPSTTDVDRTSLLVSNSGSLAGDVFGNTLAQSVVIESHQGDVLIAGSIKATLQSYLLQSGPEDQVLAPFRLSTIATGSGVQTGRIIGNTVAITLANDLDTPLAGAVAFNDVSIRTQIDSLRIRASLRKGAAVNDPFPYTLSVDESDDISIDAVAASSFPIMLSAAGNMVFTAALATAGGLNISGVNLFTVTAPISTTQGQIIINAQSMRVASSLRVTDAASDESQQDIILNASNGDVSLNGGLISAVNRVVINQKNRKTPADRLYSSRVAAQPIKDFTTASMSLTVTDDFSFDDINVMLNVTHTDLRDLSATLVAPDGGRFPLFRSSTLRGANLAATVFDSESSQSLFSGTAPYTGSFLPAASLQPLYGRNARGTWSVEVSDNAFGDSGSFTGFNIDFRDPAGASSGLVSGTSRIISDSLRVEAEGSVGNPASLPGDSDFYLHSDVNSASAFVGGSFAISDSNDINVVSLRAGGLVSLRSNGVDPVIDSAGNTATAAIRAALTDVTSLDVSAPYGSIDVSMNTAHSITLGNAPALSLTQASREGKVFAMQAAGSVTIRSLGGSTGGDFVVLDAPVAGSSAKLVRFAATNEISNVKYNPGTPGIYASTLTSTVKGSLASLLFTEASPAPRIGDRILVAGGATQGGMNANGVYIVTNPGSVTTPWQLKRSAEADTAAELPPHSIISAIEGNNAGKFYRLDYTTAITSPFGSTPITAQPVQLRTNIGSYDPNDTVRFVVSTTDGTNSSPGSLGKIIRLLQSNDPSPNVTQATEFLFSAGINTPIKLTQELPLITKAFAINGKSRYPTSFNSSSIAIDGSRIITTLKNGSVGLATVVNGFQFMPASGGATHDSAASLRNVIIGGFNQGTAVIVDGAPQVTIDNAEIGIDSNKDRLSNLNGVVVTASPGASTAGVIISISVASTRPGPVAFGISCCDMIPIRTNESCVRI